MVIKFGSHLHIHVPPWDRKRKDGFCLDSRKQWSRWSRPSSGSAFPNHSLSCLICKLGEMTVSYKTYSWAMARQGRREAVTQVIRGVTEWVLQKQRLRQSLGCKMFVGIHVDERKEEARWERKSHRLSGPSCLWIQLPVSP